MVHTGARRWREFAVYVATFTGPLAGNAVLALIGTLADEWDVTETAVLISIPAFMFPFAVIQLFSGPISDAYDRRKTITLGLGVYIVGSLMCAASASLVPFLAARVVQGVGYAFVNPVLVAVLSDVAGPSRQGIAMGFYGSSTSAGVASGPFLAGALAEVNWRLAFGGIALLALAVMFLFRLLFEPAAPKRRDQKQPALRQLVAAATNRDVVLLSTAGFLTFLAFVGVFSFVAVYLEEHLELNPSEIGLALSVSGLVGIFVSPVAGRFVDKIGPKCCIVIGFATIGATSFALPLAGTYVEFLTTLPFMGVGSAFVWSALLTMLMRVDPSTKENSSSIFNSARFSGYAISPVLLTPLYSAHGFGPVAVACGVLALVALVLAEAVSPRLNKG